MPVPTLVTDLSTTLASNSPAGSDNVFPDLDNYLRAMSGFIASIRDNSGNGWVSPYLPLTYSAGTANGVAYLNGSKVVTTGSGLVFDGSNLGLGVTPDAWQSGYRSFTMQYGGSLATTTGIVQLGQNYFYNASSQYIYRTPDFASFYRQQSGQHQWFTAPSGTAGNAITFTQAMTLTSGGDLLVGTASSDGIRLQVVGPANSEYARMGGGDAPARNLRFSSFVANGANNAGHLINAPGATGTEGTLAFATNSTERARITSGGDLLVGTTTAAGAGGVTYLNQGSTGFAAINNNNAGATGYVFTSFRRSSTEIGSITQNGTTAVQFNTTSDRRLKDNITPAPSASAVIDAIEIVSHDWKSAPDEHVTYGVIAQDLALVAPQAVLQGDDGDEIERTWGVDYSKLVPMLIKEIQSLRARVAALEAA